MASRTLIACAKALVDLGVDEELLTRDGLVVIKPLDTADVSSLDADCALLDGSIESDRLLEQIHTLRSQAPQCRIMVSMLQSIQDAIACLQAGVTGILRPPLNTAELGVILQRVSDGELYLDSEIVQILAMRQIKKLLQPFDALTSREYDVFCMLAEGLSLIAIAKQLDVSPKTVSNCQTQIKIKLGLESREVIAGFAKKHGLIN